MNLITGFDDLDTVNLFANYLYGLKYVAIVLAVLMLISGLDDLFIDVAYWVRRAYRYLAFYRPHGHMGYEALYKHEEKALAIMVPAWHETGVIGPMAELAASTLDYENYHIFVGTYPNDPDTQRDVDAVCARFPNVHKVVCVRPGPTSKADCLNNVLDAILQFETKARFEFAGFILHDAEDVLSRYELRLFNMLVDRKDLIQVPVYPFERRWSNFTSMSYLDEFAELHGKDVPLREALAGQVPSAGVGTCFSRRAVLALLDDGDGVAFDVQSLTEDYDIGLKLKNKGMKGVFVRFAVLDSLARARKRKFLQTERSAHVICVREYFPDTLSAAVRQKSRWIIGIIYQGYKTHRWSSSPILNYFLWRDRKGAVANFLSFLASLIFLQLCALWLYQTFWPDAWKFLSIFTGSKWLVGLLWINLFLMLNRIAHRIIFVSAFYGLGQGMLSMLRLFWSVLINFLANWRALRQVLLQGDPRRVAWDKTTHDFPSLGASSGIRRPLGRILIAQQSLSAAQLDEALARPIPGLRLGGALIQKGLITPQQLALALAEQNGVETVAFDSRSVTEVLRGLLPAHLALRYAVLPYAEEGDTLVLASESGIDPVSLAALSRKLGRPVRYLIVPRGQVVVGLRRWYARRQVPDLTPILEDVVAKGWLSSDRADQLWAEYVSSQVLLAEILTSLGRLSSSVMGVLLQRHEESELPLGEYLIQQNMITPDMLDHALALQQEQASFWQMLAAVGVPGDYIARQSI